MIGERLRARRLSPGDAVRGARAAGSISRRESRADRSGRAAGRRAPTATSRRPSSMVPSRAIGSRASPPCDPASRSRMAWTRRRWRCCGPPCCGCRAGCSKCERRTGRVALVAPRRTRAAKRSSTASRSPIDLRRARWPPRMRRFLVSRARPGRAIWPTSCTPPARASGRSGGPTPPRRIRSASHAGSRAA